MAKRSLSEQLDEVVETIMTKPDAPHARLDPRVAALLRIAGDLRDLPSAVFKTRLKSALLSAVPGRPRAVRAAPNYGPPLRSEPEIRARLAELATDPQLVAFDLQEALRDLPELTMRFLARLNRCTLGVSRFSNVAHWERHPAGDELLYILEGEADVTTLTDDGPVQSAVRAGSIFICPQGLWHQTRPRSPVSMLFATPGDGTEASDAEPPRLRGRRRGRRTPILEGRDIGATLTRLRRLPITHRTTAEEADAAFRAVGELNECTLAVGGFSGQSPWERHPNGDELLQVLDGEVDITVLTDDGPVDTTVHAGSIFVCPRGLWHRQRSRGGVTGFYATPRPSQISWADDPRTEA